MAGHMTDADLMRQDRAYEAAALNAETEAEAQDAFERDIRDHLKTTQGVLEMLDYYKGGDGIEPLCGLLLAVKEKDAAPFDLLAMRGELLKLEDGYVEHLMQVAYGDRV